MLPSQSKRHVYVYTQVDAGLVCSAPRNLAKTLSHPTHAHVALGVNDLKPLFDGLRFLARALALLLGPGRVDCGDWCCCARWFGTDVVKVSFA